MTHGIKVEASLTLRDLSLTTERGDSSGMGRGIEVLHPAGFETGPATYVILVHGYNVNHDEARVSYARFRWWLDHFGARARVLELHWPGDHKWGDYAVAAYPMKITTAGSCGRRLGDWLSRRPSGSKFILVGHSLGCRVVMEAIDALRSTGQLHRVSDVCLMAAAVPVREVRRNSLGPLRSENSPRWQVLYSRGDKVLDWSFRSGQTFGLSWPGSRAIGLTGEPTDRWQAPHSRHEMAQISSTQYWPQYYDHGHYWQGGAKSENDDSLRYWRCHRDPIPAPTSNRGGSAAAVARMLGAQVPAELPVLASVPVRTTPVRYLPE